jgi:hypothetical protein
MKNSDKPSTLKPWSPPQLIVLMRPHPEEHVLASCKLIEVSSGAGSDDSRCFDEETACLNDCSSQVGS